MLALLVIAPLKPITLMAVGDVMLDRYVGRAIARYGAGYPLSRVRPFLDQADLVVGNLECPITSRPRTVSKHFVFRASPAHASALAGFDVLSVANNHSLDCGRTGLDDTVAGLSKLGIAGVGTSLEPVVVTRGGVRIAFLAFSDFPEPVVGTPLTLARTTRRPSPPEGRGDFGLPSDSKLGGGRPLTLARATRRPSPSEGRGDGGVVYYVRERMARAIADARQVADVVVVIAHWGIEGEVRASARQKQEAKEMAAAGADLILGAHPHVLQPVERIGKTVVAYSMGNFVFDATTLAERKTAIFSFTISKNGVHSWRLVPCSIRNGRPEPVRKN